MATDKKHTHLTCLKGHEQEKWIKAKFGQLDKHHFYGMYCQPISLSAVPEDAKLICHIWNYSQKGSGEHKARKYMDDNQLVHMGVKISNTYATCMEQHSPHLSVAGIKYLGNIIQDGDVLNAYAHALAQGTIIYIFIGKVFQVRYSKRSK
jgi:hypothetical protein